MLRAELLTEAIGLAVKMNSQQNRVNDYSPLSHTVIDLRLAMVFVFIDAIVYLFSAQRLLFCPAGCLTRRSMSL